MFLSVHCLQSASLTTFELQLMVVVGIDDFDVSAMRSSAHASFAPVEKRTFKH